MVWVRGLGNVWVNSTPFEFGRDVVASGVATGFSHLVDAVLEHIDIGFARDEVPVDGLAHPRGLVVAVDVGCLVGRTASGDGELAHTLTPLAECLFLVFGIVLILGEVGTCTARASVVDLLDIIGILGEFGTSVSRTFLVDVLLVVGILGKVDTFLAHLTILAGAECLTGFASLFDGFGFSFDFLYGLVEELFVFIIFALHVDVDLDIFLIILFGEPTEFAEFLVEPLHTGFPGRFLKFVEEFVSDKVHRGILVEIVFATREEVVRGFVILDVILDHVDSIFYGPFSSILINDSDEETIFLHVRK